MKLNDEILEKLNEWLGTDEDRPLPTLEALDGFLTAVSIAPELPGLEPALPVVFGRAWGTEVLPSDPVDVLEMVRALWGELQQHLSPAADLEALDHWSPLLFEIEEGTDEESRETGWASHWAYGFHLGIESCKESRKALEAADQSDEESEDAVSVMQWLVPLTLLEYGGDPDESKERMTYQELKALEAPLMDSVLELRGYFADYRRQKRLGTIQRDQVKIGRNDPCTCGSGRKYKKCCGANQPD